MKTELFNSLERQVRIAIRDERGNVHRMTYRENTSEPINTPERRKSNWDFKQSHKSHNISLSTKIGDSIYWLGSDFYMTKYEGVVIQAKQLFWDWSKPVGQREVSI